ncbi:unnamed protein product, partial [Durusdinium trenchii]
MKRARRAMKHRSKEDSGDSSCTSAEGSSSSGDEAHLFEETRKIRKAAMKGPGALSAHTIASMSRALLTHQGLPIEIQDGPVPCVALQYHKQVLSQKLSPPLCRESLNLCAATDAILSGQVALGVDILLQRLKSVESLGGGQSWAASQKLELTPQEGVQLAGVEESKTANKELREELKNRQATQRTWGKSDKGTSKSKQEEAEIETELEEMARLASCGAEQTSRVQTDDLLQMQMPYGSGRLYNHSSVAILASTVPDEDAASEGKPTTSPLEERKKELGAGGFRFVDVVGDLTRDLSPFLRKTLTKGEVFPLPYGSSLAGPPFDVLDAEVEYDCTRFLLDGWEKVSNEPYPTFTTSRPSRTPGRGPAGLQQSGEDVLRDWASDLHRFPPYQYLHKFRLQDKHGNTRLLNCEEREVLMGFPRGYTVQCYPKQEQNTQAWQDERLTLVGNSWNVFVVAWLLTQLSLVLGIGPRLSLREVVE